MSHPFEAVPACVTAVPRPSRATTLDEVDADARRLRLEAVTYDVAALGGAGFAGAGFAGAGFAGAAGALVEVYWAETQPVRPFAVTFSQPPEVDATESFVPFGSRATTAEDVVADARRFSDAAVTYRVAGWGADGFGAGFGAG